MAATRQHYLRRQQEARNESYVGPQEAITRNTLSRVCWPIDKDAAKGLTVVNRYAHTHAHTA